MKKPFQMSSGWPLGEKAILPEGRSSLGSTLVVFGLEESFLCWSLINGYSAEMQ